jgi:hypothetical protein
MKRTVYIETTVVGYLAMRPSRDIRIAANQITTRDWWSDRKDAFDTYISQFVMEECKDGDPIAAQERLVYLDGIPILDMNEAVESLAQRIASLLNLPPKAAIDAFHISMA